MGVVIFLIDDDEDDHEIFQIALKRATPDVQFFSAFNGIEALQMLEIDPDFVPDCVFLDLNMPLMNGKECLTRIRQMHKMADIPVFIYTTSFDAKDEENVLAEGANALITKPSDIEQMVIILRNIFNKIQEVKTHTNTYGN